MISRRLAVVGAGVLLTIVTAAGCGIGDKYSQPHQDGPRSGVKNNAPADVVEMPDGFSNLTTKCNGPDRVYVAYHGNSSYAAIAVVPNDSTCK